MKNKVPGGYVLIARLIFESAIWRDDPHILKLFIYLIGMARHESKPKRYPDVVIKRGEMVTSFNRIAEANEYIRNGAIKRWSKQKVGRMLNVLEKQGYIKRISDTYGTHLTICNYETYQNPGLYSADSVVTAPDGGGTEVELNNNDKNGNNEKKGKELPSEQNAFKKPSLKEWKNFGYGYACEYFNFAIDKEITFAKLENSYEYWFVPNGSGKTNWEKKKRSDWKRTVQTKIRSAARAIRSYNNSRRKSTDKNREILTGR